MGKNSSAGNSWLNVVKKAFRSPTKSTKSSKRREEHEQEEDEKKRGKRRWIFSKPCIYETTIQHYASANSVNDACNHTCSSNNSAQTLAVNPKPEADDYERQANSFAMATTATAEAVAAVAAVQAAVKVIRLASPSKTTIKKNCAAIVIQTAFRAYLARRALRALQGIVKLQALVRGQNVRKQAKMTLRCIESLVRVQTRARDQRRRLSYEGSKDSTFNVSNNLEAASERNNALSTAFSRQMWRSGKDQFLCNEGEEEKSGWSDHWKKIGRNSSDQRDPIKTVEIDTAQSYSVSSSRGSHSQHCQDQLQIPSSESDCSPMHRTNKNLPITSFQYNTKRLQVHSASPRCLKIQRSFMMAQTPTLGSSNHKMFGHANAVAASMPNYMASTASAMARSRSESAPRHRPSAPEREILSSAKKRLSFPAREPDACAVMSDTELESNLRSPCSRYELQFEMRRRSNTLLRGQPWRMRMKDA